MNFIRTILLTLMMTTPVMANGIDDREQFYDDIYDAYYNAIREHRMRVSKIVRIEFIIL